MSSFILAFLQIKISCVFIKEPWQKGEKPESHKLHIGTPINQNQLIIFS